MSRPCACCLKKNLKSVWKLPELPLTGIYVNNPSDFNFKYFHNQELYFCENCSHLQLDNLLDPTLLYQETYTHRTSLSPISKNGNEFLLNYILKKNFTNKAQVLEIGCNDTYLLENMELISNNRAGIDPIFGNKTRTLESGIKVKGGFAENIDYEDVLEKPIDLIISAHTFEHIMNPLSSLSNIKKYLAKSVDFIIEVPSSCRMVQQLRLDQVFSQHVNYYSPKSLETLMSNLDLHLVEICHNFNYWGGTQILHFSNYQNLGSSKAEELKFNLLQESIESFKTEINNVKFKIRNAPGKVFAFGAAQMLPILQYHIGEEFNSVSFIFDDNIERMEKYFPFSNIQIKSIKNFNFAQNDTVLITALDSAKPIIKRLLDLNINLILLPVGNI